MANNYTEATVQPSLPASVCTPERIESLASAGFVCEADGENFYFYSETGPNDEDENGNPTNWEKQFQSLLQEAGIPELVVEGCYRCDKYRPGEFGGFVVRITPVAVQRGGTQITLEQWREDEPGEHSMSKTQHTPGPWYEAETGNHQGLVISEATSANVAVAYDKKDARLIAAAPALFAALQALLEVVPMCEASDVVRWRIANQAGAAIQQARGE